VRVYIIANIHIEFTYVCVYFDVYSHKVYMCVCICFRVCTQSCTQNSHVYVYILTYIHRESTRGCVKYAYMHPAFTCMCVFICVYVHRVQTYMWMCMYSRVGTRSLGVGMYTCAYTCRVRMGVCIHLCVSGYMFTYVRTEFTCVCVYSRIYIHRLCVCVYICVYVHRVYMRVRTYLRIYTQSLHVCVYRFTYMDTEVACVCVYIYVYHTEFTCVCVYICVYIHTDLTCSCVHIDV